MCVCVRACVCVCVRVCVHTHTHTCVLRLASEQEGQGDVVRECVVGRILERVEVADVIAVDDGRHAHHIQTLNLANVSALVHLLCQVTCMRRRRRRRIHSHTKLAKVSTLGHLLCQVIIERTFETVYEEEDTHIFYTRSPSRVPVRQSSSSTGANYFFFF